MKYNLNILSLYIIKEVLKGSAIALIILLTLFNLFTLGDELKDIGIGDYGLKQVFLYLILASPRVFYELIPSAALLGSLFVMGAMANHSEIVAMRATGLSIFWVIKSVMWAGAVLFIVSIFVGEFIAPDTERKAQLLKVSSQNNKIIMQSKHGLWLREGGRFINVRTIQEKNKLSDIFIYTLNAENKFASITQVERASFMGNAHWQAQGIKQTNIAPQISTSNQEQMSWKTLIDPDLLSVVVVKPENMSLVDLYTYIDFLQKNKQKSQSYQLAFWSRLINPLVTFVMLMVAIPFVMGTNRGVSTGVRIMIGIVIGITFNIFDKIIGHIGLVYEFNPILMAIFPSLLVFCGATYKVYRLY